MTYLLLLLLAHLFGLIDLGAAMSVGANAEISNDVQSSASELRETSVSVASELQVSTETQDSFDLEDPDGSLHAIKSPGLSICYNSRQSTFGNCYDEDDPDPEEVLGVSKLNYTLSVAGFDTNILSTYKNGIVALDREESIDTDVATGQPIELEGPGHRIEFDVDEPEFDVDEPEFWEAEPYTQVEIFSLRRGEYLSLIEVDHHTFEHIDYNSDSFSITESEEQTVESNETTDVPEDTIMPVEPTTTTEENGGSVVRSDPYLHFEGTLHPAIDIPGPRTVHFVAVPNYPSDLPSIATFVVEPIAPVVPDPVDSEGPATQSDPVESEETTEIGSGSNTIEYPIYIYTAVDTKVPVIVNPLVPVEIYTNANSDQPHGAIDPEDPTNPEQTETTVYSDDPSQARDPVNSVQTETPPSPEDPPKPYVEPEEASKPENPIDPKTSEVSQDPKVPANPENPENPTGVVQTETRVNAQTSEGPVAPVGTSEPADPVNQSEDPVIPEAPANTESQVNPKDSETPVKPEDPVDPVDPEMTATTDTPIDLEHTETPVVPEYSVSSVNPKVPAAPEDPVNTQVYPTALVNPEQTENPSNPANSVEPENPDDPSDPTPVASNVAPADQITAQTQVSQSGNPSNPQSPSNPTSNYSQATSASQYSNPSSTQGNSNLAVSQGNSNIGGNQGNSSPSVQVSSNPTNPANNNNNNAAAAAVTAAAATTSTVNNASQPTNNVVSPQGTNQGGAAGQSGYAITPLQLDQLLTIVTDVTMVETISDLFTTYITTITEEVTGIVEADSTTVAIITPVVEPITVTYTSLEGGSEVVYTTTITPIAEPYTVTFTGSEEAGSNSQPSAVAADPEENIQSDSNQSESTLVAFESASTRVSTHYLALVLGLVLTVCFV